MLVKGRIAMDRNLGISLTYTAYLLIGGEWRIKWTFWDIKIICSLIVNKRIRYFLGINDYSLIDDKFDPETIHVVLNNFSF